MAEIEFAWELGGHTGHVTTLLPVARALAARGRTVRFLLKDERAGGDLDGIGAFPREGAPHWVGPAVYADPLNFAEILHNFGYHDPIALRQLVDAWREKLWLSHLVVANVAPAAHLAARTLGIPSLEISQSFHIPPPAMPTPPLRDWEPALRARLEESDRRVLGAVNEVLAAFGVAPLATVGEIFYQRALLLTYPELDIYPERGPADYYGIPESGEGSLVPEWPHGGGPRVLGYLYNYYQGLPQLLAALEEIDARALVLCRGASAEILRRFGSRSVRVLEEPMKVSVLLPQSDLVVCHGSHQMTAQALLAGKPLLMAPTQLEQFLITRRVVRFGAGLGIAPNTPDADFGAAIDKLCDEPRYAARARAFSLKYGAHDRRHALESMVRRCEEAMGRAQPDANRSGHASISNAES